MHRFGQLALLVPAGSASSVAAVVQFMAEHGYRLIDITDINRSPKDNVLWLTELVFLRNGSPLLSAATSYE
jgi:hypothetical protein